MRSADYRAQQRALRKATLQAAPPTVESGPQPVPPPSTSDPAPPLSAGSSSGSVFQRVVAEQSTMFKRNEMERIYNEPADDQYSSYRLWLEDLLVTTRDDWDCDDDDHCIIR